MVIMAVDLGTARTGIAVSDAMEIFAFPRDVIHQKNRELLYPQIAEVAKNEKAELIVLGLPKNMDGTAGFKAEESQKAKEILEEISGIPVELWDERMTTVIAHKNLHESGVGGKKHRKMVDSVAATIILQGYLDYRKNQK